MDEMVLLMRVLVGAVIGFLVGTYMGLAGVGGLVIGMVWVIYLVITDKQR